MKKLILETLKELETKLKFLKHESKGTNNDKMNEIIYESNITMLRKILADDITRLRQKKGSY